MRDRESMVRDQIERRGVLEPAVLDAMRRVPRHRFIPVVEAGEAYDDHPLPIGFGQTISQPYIVAFMCELARLGPEDRVLEVGTGSGYHAAVMAQIARKVYSIEIVGELAERAARTIAELGYDNVHVRHADGYYGWAEQAPFDAIVVTAAAETMPPPLVEQLAEGGRMVIPVGPLLFAQELLLAEKRDGEMRIAESIGVRFVPLTGDHGASSET